MLLAMWPDSGVPSTPAAEQVSQVGTKHMCRLPVPLTPSQQPSCPNAFLPPNAASGD
uniref:HDC16612 n=1 Tax=Drosophila melanogaster TaxID=7227 RepID=Q6IIX4_DROME|nr:TPA_inf: HDC16612 [Drosophila melanogaster]